MKRFLILLIVICWLAALPSSVYARAGGGCLEVGTLISTPSGYTPIEQLKPGDMVLSVFGSSFRKAIVQAVYSVKPDEYYELAVDGHRLRLTGEHPVKIADGLFRQAAFIQTGDIVYVQEDLSVRPFIVKSVNRLPALTFAYNLLVSPDGTYLANGIAVHNKGCFLPETLIRKDDGTEVSISAIRPNDRLLAFTANGQMVSATVQDVLTHQVSEYRVIKAGSITVQVTAEHPFYVGNGTFKTVESLHTDDEIFVFDGQGLSPRRINTIEIVIAPTRVYNLQTDKPNTFFANGIAVHNKGGGGGCFPAGTLIQTPNGDIPIESINAGDWITAVKKDGQSISVRVMQTHKTQSLLLCIMAGGKSLRTTPQHPLCLVNGSFLPAGQLKPGQQILLWNENKILPAAITSQQALLSAEQDVYNLTVEWPHTFIADGFVVHNKGGGGFRGSSHRSSGSSSGSGSSDNPWPAFIFVGIFILFIFLAIKGNNKNNENLDFTFSRRAIEKKSAKTLKLLKFLSKQDPSVAPDLLKKQAEITFLKSQNCWEARNYKPMKNMMMTDLYANHCLQIQGLIRNHEINNLGNFHIDTIDLVNIRYTHKETQREFTALITATACDFYVDDRTHKRIRGDTEPSQFQEFWTFQYVDQRWLVRQIEQSRESDALKEDNFFEQFTDKGLEQIYGQEASKEGPSGPWLEKGTETRDVRIERMLNFLVQTDKIWDRQSMLETTRRIFLEMVTAWESGDPAKIPIRDIFPEIAESLSQGIVNNKEQSITREFRNVCVRKIELILIRNLADNTNDEFVARVRAHAQRIIRRRDQIIKKDEDVTPFEQYLTMGRLDNQWKLKEIISAKAGQTAMTEENLDEDSSSQQVQWYYQHKRAL